MQNCDHTHTRLEAIDLLATLDYRARPLPARLPREPETPPPPAMLHDFLVMSIRPDLTPGLLADGAIA
jgi:hypothetical protein